LITKDLENKQQMDILRQLEMRLGLDSHCNRPDHRVAAAKIVRKSL